MTAMWNFIRQYQALVVGGVGFGGVILTLITNARLSRLQHLRQIQHEAPVLRAALKAELDLIRNAFQDRIDSISDAECGPGQTMLIPLNSMSDVYTSMIGRIGLLSPAETRAVYRHAS